MLRPFVAGKVSSASAAIDLISRIFQDFNEKIAVIDAAIAGTSRLIDLVQQYRASLIHHVVTGARDVRQAAAISDALAPDPRILD